MQIDDVRSFALGIARLVFLERGRHPASRHDEFEERVHSQLPASGSSVEHPLHGCLDRCLDALPEEGRTLILTYYTDERRAKIDHRLRLAADLGLSANALRSRAQRLRDRLERCVRTCAASEEVALPRMRHETLPLAHSDLTMPPVVAIPEIRRYLLGELDEDRAAALEVAVLRRPGTVR